MPDRERKKVFAGTVLSQNSLPTDREKAIELDPDGLTGNVARGLLKQFHASMQAVSLDGRDRERNPVEPSPSIAPRNPVRFNRWFGIRDRQCTCG